MKRNSKKPRIGLLGLTLELYGTAYPDFKSERANFALRLIERFESEADLEFLGVADTREEFERQVKYFEDQDFDGLLLLFLSYAPSLIAAPALMRTDLPLTLINTQEAAGIPLDAPSSLLMDNHGVHGVQDLASVLARQKRSFSVVSGHCRESEFEKGVVENLRAMKAAGCMKRFRIGLLGHSMQDMGDFNVDETALLTEVGPSVRHLAVDILADGMESAPDRDIKGLLEEYRDTYIWDEEITEKEAELAARMEWALRRLLAEYRCDGWAQHFMSLGQSERITTLPFLAASRLMAEGIGYGAEGDVTAAAAMLLVRELAGEAGFTEMFSVDYEEGAVLMRHMGEGNPAFAREESRVRVVRNKFNLVDVLPCPAPVFAAQPGEVTLVSLTVGAEGRFKLVTAEGEITEFPGRNHATSPESKWRPNAPLVEFLDSYAEAGGSHHQALGYGRLARGVESAARHMGLEFISVC